MTSPAQTAFRLTESEFQASALRAQVLERCKRTLNHDMNNAVQSMHSGLELLAKCIKTPGGARVSPQECIELLQQQFSTLQQTLNKLIADIAEAPGAPETFDLSAVVHEALQLLRHERAVHKAQLRIDAGVHAHARRVNIRTYVLAVLLDAIDRLASDSALEVSLTRDDEQASLSIRTSSGSQQRVAERGPTIVQLVKRLIAAEEGELSIEQTAAVHTITLTLSAPAEQADEVRRLTSSGNTQLRVLIADRHRDAADGLAMILQLEGHEAKVVYDAAKMNDVLQSFVPDVIVFDADLPGSDVDQLARAARELPTRPTLAQVSSTRRAAAAHFDAHLRRPVEWPELQKLLQGHMTRFA